MKVRHHATRATNTPLRPPLWPAIRQSFRLNWGNALLASALATVAALLLRLLTGLPTPAELFGDRITILIPVPIFSRLLQLFGPNAKHVFFVTLVIGQFVLTALAGALYAAAGMYLRKRDDAADDLRLWEIPLLAALLWLASAGVLAPIIGAGFLGAGLAGGAGAVLRAEIAPDALFAASFVWLLRREARAPVAATTGASGAQAAALSRRRLLRQTGIAVAVIAGGVLVWEGVSAGLGSIIGLAGRHRPQLSLSNSPAKVAPPTPNYGDWAPIAGQTPEITAAKDFYYVSKNLVSDPSINATQWSLKIAGMVNAPYNLTYDELRALPSVRQYHTLECISNEVGGNLMSNALFTGVRLADVLNTAGIQNGASQVTFRADDDYSDSLHLSQALNPDSLIVYLINGDPLPQAHGYPARLLIPGLYGMKNGKWLTSLTVGSGTYDGYWEQRGWTHEAKVKMTARIDVPSDGDLLTAKPTAIAGVAYSGDQGIAEVDVSVDGGQSWRVATLRRPLGALTWVLWELPWTPSSGSHIIVARAIDNAGNVQTTAGAPPIPDGASGYDAISVVAH